MEEITLYDNYVNTGKLNLSLTIIVTVIAFI